MSAECKDEIFIFVVADEANETAFHCVLCAVRAVLLVVASNPQQNRYYNGINRERVIRPPRRARQGQGSHRD